MPIMRFKPLYVPYWKAPGVYIIGRFSRSGHSAWMKINGEVKCVPLECLERA